MGRGSFDLLLVDDDERFRRTLANRFRQRGIRVQDAGDGKHAWELAQRHAFDVAVFDMVMPEMSGMQLLEQFKEAGLECSVILLTGQSSVESAVNAMKLGAYDYLTKPFPLRDLEKLIEKASQQHELSKENVQLKTLLKRNLPNRTIIGEAPAMQELFRLISRAGPSDKPVLIEGESGTGKELVAWALHENSPRSDRPMVTINCAALPEALLESELFGHERGAFTGAESAKPGLFEVADGGTVFIDEIGEMPIAVQVKLLRVLEDGWLRRVGSIREHRVDVRLLAATNRDLEREVERGRFRHDLFYRINVMSLELPPLRERTGDIERLVEHFAGDEWEVEDTAMQLLENYHWPGNVRQLINAIERAKILSEDGFIRSSGLPRQITKGTVHNYSPISSVTDELATIERVKLLEVLQREDGNKTRTANVLGIERRKLYRLLEKHKIQPEEIADRR